MHFLSANKKQQNAGFTLIEMLIIAPIVIIAISGFIALMVSVVGKVLLTRDQGAVTYNTQNALGRIEEDVKLSAKFLTTTEALPSPQGSNNNFTGTAEFTNTSNTLILNALATDSNPHSSDRWLMYYANQPNPCGDTETGNRVFSTRIIYFIKDGSLWRRTYVPDWNLNTSSPDANTICTHSSNHYPWQQNSCSPGYTDNRCKAEDERVMDDISSLNVQYFADSNSTTDLGASGAESATTINVTIDGGKTTAGNTHTASSSLRVTKLNSITTDASPLTTPVVSHAQPTPDTVTFSWAGVTSATNYLVSYNINGGSWVNTTLGDSTLNYTVTANRGDTISIKVAATNGTYTSGYGTDASTLPLWSDITLQNSWEYYGAGYNTPQFTKTSACRVFLKGLIRYGTATNGTVIGTLPEGYRPLGRLIFQSATSHNGPGRIDVRANGDIVFVAGSSSWISMDNISFTPSSCSTPWNALPFYNGWSNYGGEYEAVHATKDSLGRVSTQGLARAGTTADYTQIVHLADIDSSYTPTPYLHFPAGSNGWGGIVFYGSGSVKKRDSSNSNGWLAIYGFFHPGSIGSWSSPTLQNGWLNYGSGFPNLQYTKDSDGVVSVRGLVKSGSTTSGAVIANLPAGYRPSGRELLSVSSNGAFGRCDITTDGNIRFQSGSNSWYAINLSFVAD